MNMMERIEAVTKATETDTPFLHATNMEAPLTSIRNLASALCLLAEAMEEQHGLVVQELAYLIRDKIDELDKEHEYFFNLHHPCPPLEGGGRLSIAPWSAIHFPIGLTRPVVPD
jgi:hypothetical protein